jgi:Uma2 family endonuclease
MDVQLKPYLTPEDYLAFERQAETRSEYLDGKVLATAGGSLRHNVIVGNLVGELSRRLKSSKTSPLPVL